jgi:murein DD-endopeptidase MepM/ murein hydrolase activator NlpD
MSRIIRLLAPGFGLALAACASAPAPRSIEIPASPPVAEAPPPDTPAAEPPAPVAPPVAASLEEADLFLCPMNVVNAPDADASGRIVGATREVVVRDVTLLLAPVSVGCVSSGFGLRNGRPHRGVDYYATSGDALAAGAGVILEAATRADFGNMIVIDHGGGVFTRYGHLAAFAGDIGPGRPVAAGDRLGLIGQTGQARAPHLHYEILTGEYRLPAGSFGLVSIDPFSLIERPAASKVAMR